ncbi:MULTISPECIES: OFA family MFS transporter [unclassified Actinotalea]|uniref:L-lactate MFS transporter n=1 Tax=unclassified Actinotalea TaxID=2638618 RepID=UPI0015F5B797|nr:MULTISPECIES: OFA family MFS transporter [unclassified Actinotalea]
MSRTATPTINRWAVLWGSVAILMCTGAIYSFSVFAGPLSGLRGWTMPEVMMAFTINAAIGPIPMILGGWIVDKGGARVSILVGGLMFAAGFMLTGISTTTTMLYLSYGVLAGLGQGLAYSGCLNNTMKLFPDKRGLAAGLITGGMGAASVIAAPAAQAIIKGSGVTTAFVAMGAVYAVVVVVAALFLRAAPVGYTPAGWTPPAGAGGQVNLPWTGMVRTPAFVLIFLMMGVGAFSGLMIASQASGIGQSAMFGLSATTAAVFVSIYAACNMLGRIVWGAVSDRLGYTTGLMLIYTVVGLSMLVLVTVSSTVGFAIGIIGLGLCFGGVMGIFPALTMKNFGPRFQGINYGIVFTAYSVAAFFAPRIAASMGAEGDYTKPFIIAIALAVVGLLLTLVLVRVSRRPATPTDTPATPADRAPAATGA